MRLVGRGPLEKDLKTQVKQLRISDKVEFINNYAMPNPRSYVHTAMKNADIFIHDIIFIAL